MEKSYAQVLWNMIQGGEKPKKAVEKIYASLKSRGRAEMMPAIGRAFKRLAIRESLKNRSVLVVARKGDAERARRSSGADKATLEINESLIGGWQFFGKGHMTDRSWKSALLTMYSAATSA